MVNAGDERLRLFLALWPTNEVRQRIARDLAAAIGAAGGSPVPAVNYHVTLAFLGSVRQSSINDINRFLHDVRFKRFALSLDRTGFWPRSQLAWLGPSTVPLELSSLVENIWDKLENLGFLREQIREYLPHVTLCRNVNAGLGMKLESPIVWPVDSFGLAISRPAEHGPIYSVLEHFHAGD